MPHIEQHTRRRTMRVGLTALDESKACPGYVLYTPVEGDGTLYLIDLMGDEVHQWKMPHRPGLYGYLLPNGNLFYNGKIPDDSFQPFEMWPNFKGGVMLEADWDGNVLWEYRNGLHHHDARRTESGGVILLGLERVPEELAAKVQGGVPGTGADGMWADEVVEVDASGDRIWEWHAHEHLDVDTDHILFNDPRDYWSHGNTIVPLPDDKLLLSFRSISTVGIIDKRTGEFDWKLGYDVLTQQHDPNMLPNGNVLVFDNGAHKRELPMTSSRVIEVDPSTNEIVWQYEDRPVFNFFSPFVSGARRLPNGNTLITEGFFGRMFQVTPDGEVVWEYTCPYFPEGARGPSNSVFRALHYTREELPDL